MFLFSILCNSFSYFEVLLIHAFSLKSVTVFFLLFHLEEIHL